MIFTSFLIHTNNNQQKYQSMFIKNKLVIPFFLANFCFLTGIFSQKIVPVKEEPRHVPVLTNKYIRVIDAEIEDGDSSLFHVHETPSAFIFLTDVMYDNQILNGNWQKINSKKGFSWYSSYETGGVTHRVVAPKGQRIHAYDIELLSKYSIVENPKWKPMEFDTTFMSDRCVGYSVQLSKEKPSVQFSGRNPIIAIFVEGEEVTISQPDTRVQIELAEEEFGYIKPSYSCTIKLKTGNKAKLVLFEVR